EPSAARQAPLPNDGSSKEGWRFACSSRPSTGQSRSWQWGRQLCTAVLGVRSRLRHKDSQAPKLVLAEPQYTFRQRLRSTGRSAWDPAGPSLFHLHCNNEVWLQGVTVEQQAERQRGRSALRAFLDSEATGGILLMMAAALAMVAANSPLREIYHNLLHQPLGPELTSKLGPMTAHLWINDGLMAVFFLLVGLEIKREFVDGRLA